MKKGIVDKPYKILLLSNYLSFGILGWLCGGMHQAIMGIALALLIDGFFPKWTYELSWKDINNAIKNHMKFGSNGTHLTFKIGGRKLHFYRDDKGDPYRLGVRIPLKSWEGVFEKNDIKSIVKQYGGMTIKDRWHFQDTIVYFPDNELEDCVKILRLFIEKTEGRLNPKISARSYGYKKDIWKRYD
jgi:hypothetical protein